jgi:hypothetical protein
MELAFEQVIAKVIIFRADGFAAGQSSLLTMHRHLPV